MMHTGTPSVILYDTLTLLQSSHMCPWSVSDCWLWHGSNVKSIQVQACVATTAVQPLTSMLYCNVCSGCWSCITGNWLVPAIPIPLLLLWVTHNNNNNQTGKPSYWFCPKSYSSSSGLLRLNMLLIQNYSSVDSVWNIRIHKSVYETLTIATQGDTTMKNFFKSLFWWHNIIWQASIWHWHSWKAPDRTTLLRGRGGKKWNVLHRWLGNVSDWAWSSWEGLEAWAIINRLN